MRYIPHFSGRSPACQNAARGNWLGLCLSPTGLTHVAHDSSSLRIKLPLQNFYLFHDESRGLGSSSGERL